MMSSPSPRTQRRYGVSFSVENFFASSSETMASLAMPCSCCQGSALSCRSPMADFRPWDSHAFVRLHAQIDRISGRRAQRRMRLCQQHNIADLDMKIQIVAEEILGVDGALADVVAVGGGGRSFRQFHVLGPHRYDDGGVLAHALARMRLEFAHGRADDAAAIAERGDGAADEIGGADEIGDELVGGLLVDLARRAD